MTRLQAFAAKFSACKLLITASTVWFVFLIVLHYKWSPELIESTQYDRLEEYKPLRQNQNRIPENLLIHESTSFLKKDVKMEIAAKAKLEAKIKAKSQTAIYENLVTPVSSDILNELGLVNPGEYGRPVKLVNVSANIQKKIDKGWKRHEFNEFVSDLVSVRRFLPDPREAYCKQSNLYLDKLPSTSVIIIFHNEAWSTLLRSIHSVLDRSPPHLIKEIILVDDYSNMEHLKKPLENYILNLPKVKILRADKREGLIKARIRGAVAATAETLTFLDSHIECATGWLEPLLDRIARNSTTVVCPMIDVIEDDTLEFSPQLSKHLQVGGFDWFLIFDWHIVPKQETARRKNVSEPARSPTMAGGLFSIDKAFFEKLGMYDPDFDIWGGENLELSFKTWMCGGTLEILPCSHVGHIFRKKSPYKWRPGVDVLRKNLVRLAEVWLDDYAKYYYLRTGFDKGDFGDISGRVKLRQDLKCKSFQWYIDNVYPEVHIPDNFAEGFVTNMGLTNESCLDAPVDENETNGSLTLYKCLYKGGNQFFEYTKRLEFKKNDHCLEYYDNEPSSLQLYRCHRLGGNQEWHFNMTTSQLTHTLSSKCLSVEVDTPVMVTCDEKSLYQKWIFKYLYKEKLEAFKV